MSSEPAIETIQECLLGTEPRRNRGKQFAITDANKLVGMQKALRNALAEHKQ